MSTVAREFHLGDRPEGLPQVDHFRLVERVLDAPGKGQLLVRNEWL